MYTTDNLREKKGRMIAILVSHDRFNSSFRSFPLFLYSPPSFCPFSRTTQRRTKRAVFSSPSSFFRDYEPFCEPSPGLGLNELGRKWAEFYPPILWRRFKSGGVGPLHHVFHRINFVVFVVLLALALYLFPFARLFVCFSVSFFLCTREIIRGWNHHKARIGRVPFERRGLIK